MRATRLGRERSFQITGSVTDVPGAPAVKGDAEGERFWDTSAVSEVADGVIDPMDHRSAIFDSATDSAGEDGEEEVA